LILLAIATVLAVPAPTRCPGPYCLRPTEEETTTDTPKKTK